MPEALTQESRERSTTKYRRYHRRSRNTLFAHGDVCIGPSKYERNKVRRDDPCNEKENESESETKIESPTTKETVDDGQLDNRSERIAHLPPADEMEELPAISALPRKFTLTHESEKIIKEDTRPPLVLSERRATKKRKKMSTSAVPSSRRKKYSSSLSKSWVELKTENSPQRNGRPQSSRGNKVHVSPMDARASYKNPALELESPQSLSPSQIYSVPSFKKGEEMTRLDKTGVLNLPSENSIDKNEISSTVTRARDIHRTGKANEHDLTNGFKA